MIKKNTYKAFEDCFPALKTENDVKSEVLIEEYLSFDGIETFQNEIGSYITNKLQKEDRLYLVVASSGYGGTAKIRAHYKLWKALKKNFDLSKMELSEEQEVVLENNIKYVGIAQFEESQIGTAIALLYKHLYDSFIVVSNSEFSMSEKEIHSLFVNECLGNKPGMFNYSYLLGCLKDEEVAIKLQFDGEELALFMLKNKI